MHDGYDVHAGNTDQIGRIQVLADASDLGWAPGRYKMELTTDLGNGQSFFLVDMQEEYATYYQLNSDLVLHVYKD